MKKTKWEYLTIRAGKDEVLTLHGSDGWELVCVDSGWAYFKREVK